MAIFALEALWEKKIQKTFENNFPVFSYKYLKTYSEIAIMVFYFYY